MVKESSYAPEDRLLRAILGIQVSTSKETCLKLPIGGRGRVLDVRWIQKRGGSSYNPEMIRVEFQVFSFTNKIRRLTSHLELHKKDFSSQRGLRKILGKRQRMLAYLSKRNRGRYKELIGELDIREIKTR